MQRRCAATSASESEHPSYDEAHRALAARLAASRPCEDGTPPSWLVACASSEAADAASLADARKTLSEVNARLADGVGRLDRRAEELAEFGRSHIVKDRAIGRVVAAMDAVRVARDDVRSLRAEGARLEHVVLAAEGARAFGARATEALGRAHGAAAAAASVLEDRAVVDEAAEVRQRRQILAERARLEEEARRRAARQEALLAAEARRAAETERQEAAKRDAERRKQSEAERAQAARAIALASLEARRLAEAGRVADAEVARARIKEQERLALEATRQRAEAQNVAVAAGSFAAARLPSCTIEILAPAGLEHAKFALDGRPLTLPAKVRVASGRHGFALTTPSGTVRTSELVVCGRTQSIAPRTSR